jgi:FtsZ-binding cell division protein ZapB
MNMRFIVALWLLCLLTACATAPFTITREMNPHPQPELQEQEAFIAALDQFSATNKLERMISFQQDFPNSNLAAYAETINLYAEELDVRKTQVETLQQEQQELHLQLEAVRQKNQQLKEENLQLDEKIEQLKKLLIELEERPQ